MTKKKMPPRIKEQKPFTFLSRAQMLEAKAHRLNRELEQWASAGSSLTDTESQATQRMLIDEIMHLEPQPIFKELSETEGVVIPPIFSFIYEGTWRVAIGHVAMKIDDQEWRCHWYVAPSMDSTVQYTWPELLTMIGAEGLGSLEVLR